MRRVRFHRCGPVSEPDRRSCDASLRQLGWRTNPSPRARDLRSPEPQLSDHPGRLPFAFTPETLERAPARDPGGAAHRCRFRTPRAIPGPRPRSPAASGIRSGDRYRRDRSRRRRRRRVASSSFRDSRGVAAVSYRWPRTAARTTTQSRWASHLDRLCVRRRPDRRVPAPSRGVRRRARRARRASRAKPQSQTLLLGRAPAETRGGGSTSPLASKSVGSGFRAAVER